MEPENLPKIGGIILAAGSSSRLGRAKQLLLFQGETLIHRSVSILKQLPLETIYLVYGARSSELEPELQKMSVPSIYNPDWSEGMASSLKVGLSAILEASPQLSAVLITLVDQPLVRPSHLAAMLQISQQHPAAIIAAAYNDLFGVPAIFPKTHFSAIMNQKGPVGAKKIIKKNKEQVIPFPCQPAAFDIDTEADYQDLLSADYPPVDS